MHVADVIERSVGREHAARGAGLENVDVSRSAGGGWSEADVVALSVRSAGEGPSHGVADVRGCENGAERVANGEDVDGLVGGRFRVGRGGAGEGRHGQDESGGRDATNDAYQGDGRHGGGGSMSHMPMRRFGHDARNASSSRGRVMLVLCTAMASALLAACGSDSGPTGPGGSGNKSPNGSYAISTINASPLPVAIFSDTGGFKLEGTSGTLQLDWGV